MTDGLFIFRELVRSCDFEGGRVKSTKFGVLGNMSKMLLGRGESSALGLDSKKQRHPYKGPYSKGGGKPMGRSWGCSQEQGADTSLEAPQ